MSPFVRRFVSQGHLVDSGLLTGMLNLIVEEGADYRIIDFQLGKTNQDISKLAFGACTPKEFYSTTHHNTQVCVDGLRRGN